MAHHSTARLLKYFVGLCALQAALGDPVAADEPCPSPVLPAGQNGAVASESEICSNIGIDLLKMGGNAADALVGTVACIGTVSSYHSGKKNILFSKVHC